MRKHWGLWFIFCLQWRVVSFFYLYFCGDEPQNVSKWMRLFSIYREGKERLRKKPNTLHCFFFYSESCAWIISPIVLELRGSITVDSISIWWSISANQCGFFLSICAFFFLPSHFLLLILSSFILILILILFSFPFPSPPPFFFFLYFIFILCLFSSGVIFP